MIVRELFKKAKVTGDIGLEIEVEGANLPLMPSNIWRVDRDGSLRGESYEYVFKRPLNLDGVKAGLDELSKHYAAARSVHRESFRAGVHVHINCQEMTITKLFNYITLYLIFETFFIRWCGPSRLGNLFCLSTSDADFMIDQLRLTVRKVCRDKNIVHLLRFIQQEDMIRYASMNLAALHKYGSLEFRAMRSTPNFHLIYFWAKTLLKLRDVAESYENPLKIIHDFSVSGVSSFIIKVLGEELCTEFLPTSVSYMSDITDGVRNAQEIAYSGDWDTVDSLTIGPTMVDDRDYVQLAIDPPVMKVRKHLNARGGIDMQKAFEELVGMNVKPVNKNRR